MSTAAVVVMGCAVCAGSPGPQTYEKGQIEEQSRTAHAVGASVEARAGSITVGRGASRLDISERRLEPRLSYAYDDTIGVSVGVPVLVRAIRSESMDRVDVEPGDLDAWVTGSLLRQGTSLRQTASVGGVIKAPTANVALDELGDPLPASAQPGCSSLVPGASVAYALWWDRWSLSVSGALTVPFAVREAPHRGVLVTHASTLEVRPVREVGIAAGWLWIVESVGQDENGSGEPDSGGFVARVTAGVTVGRPELLEVSAGIEVPVVSVLGGDQAVGPIGMVRAGGTWELPRQVL